MILIQTIICIKKFIHFSYAINYGESSTIFPFSLNMRPFLRLFFFLFIHCGDFIYRSFRANLVVNTIFSDFSRFNINHKVFTTWVLRSTNKACRSVGEDNQIVTYSQIMFLFRLYIYFRICSVIAQHIVFRVTFQIAVDENDVCHRNYFLSDRCYLASIAFIVESFHIPQDQTHTPIYPEKVQERTKVHIIRIVCLNVVHLERFHLDRLC